MALKREGCPSTRLQPNESMSAKTRIGTSDIPYRSFDCNIGPQQQKGDASQVCQFKLQALRVRANMASPTPIRQSELCLACGRRASSESQLIP